MKKHWGWSQFWALIVVVAPFSLGVLLLEVIGPSTIRIISFLSFCQGLDGSDYITGKIAYVAITNLHIVVCVIIGIRYVFEPKETPGEKQFVCRSMLPTAVILMLLLGFIIIGGLNFSKLSSNIVMCIYGIKNDFCNFSTCSLPVYSWWEFQIASTLPVITAAIATAILVIYTNLQVYRFVKAEERDRESQFTISYNSIVQCLPMFSCLLVTGLISSAFWYHLPVKIFGNVASNDVLTNLRNYGNAMTLFFGVVYTLTALVAIAWPIWQLYRKAQNVNSSFSGQLPNQIETKKILAVLAPLATGLLYNWLEVGI
ncbi:MAG: hypothetical protein OXH65_05175 [Paracoccaceae bacterium]|nr:hypothetical protein [Paracoccaceae bacterium]MDE2674483.1 hypothetical protein [Paracoccaceae bacterium]